MGAIAPCHSVNDNRGGAAYDPDLSEDSDDDDDDDGQNYSDEDDDDDEENGTNGGVRGTEKGWDGAPQVVHVPPPAQPPTTPALFTHCQYTYIGAGRWQVYVQMWFVEERLKREVRLPYDFVLAVAYSFEHWVFLY